MVVLAKLTSPEKVGQFALGLAITAPIIQFSQLQLRGVQATDARGEYDFGHYLALRLLTTGLALAGIWAVAAWGRYDLATAGIVLAIGCSKGIDSLKDVYYGLMQRHGRMDQIAKSRILGGLLALSILGILIWTTRNLVVGIVGMLAVQFAVWLIYDRGKAICLLRNVHNDTRVGRPRFDAKRLWQLALLALPLGLVMTIISLNTNIPRYFLERYAGVAQLGIFAALAYLIVAGNTLIMALGQAALPRLANEYANGNQNKFRQILIWLVVIGMVVGAGGLVLAWLAGSWILTIVYGPEYAEYNHTFVLLMGVGAIQYVSSFLGYGMTAARYFRAQLPLFASVGLTILLVSYIAIPRWGLIGGAMALLAGACCNIVGCAVVIAHAYRNLPHSMNENSHAEN